MEGSGEFSPALGSGDSIPVQARLEMSLIGLLKQDQVLKMITDGGTRVVHPTFLRLSIKFINQIQLLGLGAFGAVFSGIYLDSSVAVKIMKMQQPDDSTVTQAFKEEIEKLM